MKSIGIILLSISIGVILIFSIKAYNNTSNNKSIETFSYESISPEAAKEKLTTSNNVLLIDVRTPEEYEAGHIKGSILVPLSNLQEEIDNVVKDKNSEIIVYCRSGNRSKTAANILLDMGF